MGCGDRRGESWGTGDRTARGEGDRERAVVRSKGEGERECGGEWAGVESGESSEMSQNSSLMSGVDCLLATESSSSTLVEWSRPRLEDRRLPDLVIIPCPLLTWEESWSYVEESLSGEASGSLAYQADQRAPGRGHGDIVRE